jgi:hypothetical protein
LRRALAALGVLLVVAALALPARATRTDVDDGNDTRGLLDLRAVVLRHDHGPYTWAFQTFSRWSARRIWDAGFFVVELDTLGSPATDYVVVVRSDGRSMSADLFRRRGGGEEVHRRRLSAWRSGSRGVDVEVPRLSLRIGANRFSFFWSATSLFTGRRCAKSCTDRAPDGDTMVEELLGAASPTPSPTVSPTTTVSPTPSPTSSPTATSTPTPTPVVSG